MSKPDETDSTVLRKGSYRFLGPVFLAIAAFSSYMLYQQQTSSAAWMVPALFVIGGLWFLLNDSRYWLSIEKGHLVWADHNGKQITTGRIDISTICRFEIYKMRSRHTRTPDKLQVELLLQDDTRHVLPSNLGFGGPGNPRYEDVLEAVQVINPAIESEVFDIEGWRKHDA